MFPDWAIKYYLTADLRRTDAGCWEWTGRVDRAGYGLIRCGHRNADRYKQVLAHRVSLYCVQGAIDPKKPVCHICNNRLCVNPNHLYQGTHAENMRDRKRAGTEARGHRHGKRTFPASKAKEAKVLLSYGMPRQKVADVLKVERRVIDRIANGVTWKTL